MSNLKPSVVLLALLGGLFAADVVVAQTTRRVARTTTEGIFVETASSVELGPVSPGGGGNSSGPPADPAGWLAGTGVIWHFVDNISITNSVAIADTTDETWVGHNLSTERLAYHQTSGDGTPIFEFALTEENPSLVAVASAEDVSLGVVLSMGPAGSSVRGFDGAGNGVPLWEHFFEATYNFTNRHNLDVSADGSLVIAAVRDSSAGTSLVVVLDGATGTELDSMIVNPGIGGIELSDDGTRAVLTEGATARIIETDGMATLFSFSVSGAGGFQRISRDGKVVAGGGFNYKVYKETDTGWTQILSGSQANQWFGNGIALDANGETLFLVHHNYATGYVDLTYRLFDLTTGLQIAETSTLGTGTLQDTVQISQASANGCVFASSSWGTADNAHPEVQVFDRDLNLIGNIDTPGSPFDIDLSRDGDVLVVGSKHVHANISGNGSDTYAYRVGAPYGPAGADLSDYADFHACLSGANVEAAPECRCIDTDGDGDVDLRDFARLENAFSGS